MSRTRSASAPVDDRPRLTPRQQAVFDFIAGYIRRFGYPPTIREIGENLGIRSTNGVADHIKTLRRKGYITQEDMKSRTLKLVVDNTLPASRTSSTRQLPILGRVAAGQPILAAEQADGTLHVDANWVDDTDAFALKIVGDSMIEDGIFNNDYVFVRKQDHANPGDIVVAVIDDEATVKRFYPEGDHIRLQPANPSMQPILVRKTDKARLQILGVVVGVYRKLH